MLVLLVSEGAWLADDLLASLFSRFFSISSCTRSPMLLGGGSIAMEENRWVELADDVRGGRIGATKASVGRRRSATMAKRREVEVMMPFILMMV